jgi:hypothetical protein
MMEEFVRSQWLRVSANPDASDDLLVGHGNMAPLVHLVVELQRAGHAVTARDLFNSKNVSDLANILLSRGRDGRGEYPAFSDVWAEGRSPWAAPEPSSMVRISAGQGSPLFFVHNAHGYIRFVERAADRFRAGRPVYGFESIGLRDRRRPPLSIAEAAERYIAEMRKVQPSGPYFIGGFCTGSHIAFEMAHRMVDAGEEVAALTLVNADRPGLPEGPPSWGLEDLYLERLAYIQLLIGDLELTANLPEVIEALEHHDWIDHVEPADFFWHIAINAANGFAQEHYEPGRYDRPAAVFQSAQFFSGDRADWRPLAPAAKTHFLDAENALAIMSTPDFQAAVACG